MEDYKIKSFSGDVWGVSLLGENVQITLYKRTVSGRGILRRELIPLQDVKRFYHNPIDRHFFKRTAFQEISGRGSAFPDLANKWTRREAKAFAVVLGKMYRAAYGEYVEAEGNG
jgi:hypothetical protein